MPNVLKIWYSNGSKTRWQPKWFCFGMVDCLVGTVRPNSDNYGRLLILNLGKNVKGAQRKDEASLETINPSWTSK